MKTEKPYAGVRALVVGASGFIGRWVARALSEQGADVCLAALGADVAREMFDRYGARGEVFDVDLRSPEAVRRLFRAARPSVTFNLAGYGVDRAERDESTAYRINMHLVSSLCDAAAENVDPEWNGRHVVHVGSALEYGEIGGDLAEDSVPKPTTLYGLSKLAGTHLLVVGCRKHEIRGVTARLFMVYGPGERAGRLLPSLLEAAATDAKVPLTAGEQRRDFTYVEDVAEGLLRLGITPGTELGEIVNLATGRLTAVHAFVETAAEVLGVASGRLDFGAVPGRPEEMAHDDVSVERLRRLTGWVPATTPAEGVRRTRDFERGLK